MPVEPIIETNPRAAPVFNKELFASRVKKIPEALQSIGFDKLRPGQQRPLYSILAEVDTLCILPTSFGKSLIYTLPSLVCGWKTMIFSPLVALMQDQVQGMWKRGIRAAQLSGMQTEAENEQAIRDWMAGDLHMLYLAPERLDNPRFIHAVQQVRPDICIVDEVHVASAWGYNFRASYRKIGDFIEEYSPRVVGLFTATCPPRVEQDVRKIFRADHAVKYVHTQRRDNLVLSSAPFNGYPDLARRVKEVPGPCVVYCSTVREVMETAQSLQTFLPQDTITIFHGQLADSEKNANLRQFMNDHARVVVCTNAFGMGVDKGDVRGVIHRNLPGTMDACIQESGRAGRDGKTSWCTMLYDEDSIKTQEFFLDSGNPPEENVRSVYGVLYRLSMGGEREIRTPQNKIAASAGISKAHISAVMELLKGEGVITTEPARDKIAKVKPLVPTETDARLKRLVDLALSEGRPDSQGWLEINLIRMADNMGIVESTLRNYLNRWTKDKLIEFQAPYIGNVTRLQKDLSGVDFGHLAEKRKADRKNLELVLEYCRAPDDEKHGLFERYLEYEHNQEGA